MTVLTFFFSTSRMRWLISFRYAEFLNTSSLQDLITLFMVSRMPITTWRSCSVRTFFTKQGITTSSSFWSAGEEKAHKQKKLQSKLQRRLLFLYVAVCNCVQFYSGATPPNHFTSKKRKAKHVHNNSFTLVVVLCGTIFPCLVLSSAKLAHCSKCCSANVVMGILRI